MVKTYIHLNRGKIEADGKTYQDIFDRICEIYKDMDLENTPEEDYDLTFEGFGDNEDQAIQFNCVFDISYDKELYKYLDKYVMFIHYSEDEEKTIDLIASGIKEGIPHD